MCIRDRGRRGRDADQVQMIDARAVGRAALEAQVEGHVVDAGAEVVDVGHGHADVAGQLLGRPLHAVAPVSYTHLPVERVLPAQQGHRALRPRQVAVEVEELVVVKGAQSIVDTQRQTAIEIGELRGFGRHGQRPWPGVLNGEKLEFAHGAKVAQRRQEARPPTCRLSWLVPTPCVILLSFMLDKVLSTRIMSYRRKGATRLFALPLFLFLSQPATRGRGGA